VVMSGRDAIGLGEAAELAGEYLDASAAYQSATDDPDHLVVADAHFHLGRLSWRQGRFDEAVLQYDLARKIAVQYADPELRARVENGLGVVHHARGELAQARASYAVALELAVDETQRGRVLLHLGAVANIEGDFASARAHYARSRAIFQHTGFTRGEVSALHNLGMLDADEGRFDEADQAYRRSLELLETLQDRQGIATVLLNRSELSCARLQFDDAVSMCDLSISVYDEIGDEIGRGEALRWKGHALRMLTQFADAEIALQDAVRIARRSQIKLLEAESSRELALTRLGQGSPESAAKLLTRALQLFEELGARRDASAVRLELAAIS
jgi:tetratricopeptide (TPR) repeat protein